MHTAVSSHSVRPCIVALLAASSPGSAARGQLQGLCVASKAGGRGSRPGAMVLGGVVAGRRVPVQGRVPCCRRREIQPARQRHRALQHDALLHPLGEAADATPPVGPGSAVPAAGAVAGAHALCRAGRRGRKIQGPGHRTRLAAAPGGRTAGLRVGRFRGSGHQRGGNKHTAAEPRGP